MKDCYSPAGTPLVLSNALNTPSGTDANHYFASSHQLLRAQDGAGSRASSSSSGTRTEDSNEALSKKLRSLQVGRYTSLIDSIPNELLSLIVELGFFDFADAEGFCPDVDFRSTVLQISQRFRQVALCTPAIWSVYHVSQGNIRSQLRHELPTNLPRSKEYPLDIRLSCFWDACYTEGLMKLLIPYSKRWRRLSIVTMNANVFDFLQHVPVPRLEEFDVAFYSHERRTSLPLNIFDGGRASRLSSLCLRNVNLTDLPISLRNLTTLEIRGYGTWPEFEQFSEMLSGSTSLEKLVLHVKPGHVVHQQLFPPVLVDSSSNNHQQTRGQIILPELRALEVYTSEWLSSGIVSLINVFASPKLESLVLREGVGSASETARTIMSYTAQPHLHRNPAQLPYPVLEPVCTGFPNRLFVQSASLSLACRSFPASVLTSLELRRVMLPSHMSMKQAFASLKNLKHLFFFDISPNEGVLQMLDNIEPVYFQEKMVREMESTIGIPSLETLMLDFRHCAVVDPLGKDYSAGFIRTFSLPALSSLVLKALTLPQWKSIADVFEAHTEEYPQLTSLKLVDIKEVLPTNTDHPSYCSLTRSFPNIRRLSLDGVTCNQVTRELLSASSTSFTIPIPADLDDPSAAAGVVFACPHLEVLSICNDSNASKPLLHRLVSSRVDAGRPLRRLCLDEHFSRNGDSWDWLKENVEVSPPEIGFF